jgi:hypothetical protein
MATPMIISSAVPPLPPVPTTPWPADAGEINIPTPTNKCYRERGGVARRSRWSARSCMARRRGQRTFSNQGMSSPRSDETRKLLRKPRPLERHWYRGLENPVESRSHIACQKLIIQRAPLMPGAASAVDSARDLGRCALRE